MFYLGNILTGGKVSNADFLNVVNKESELKPGIPTLIVGWERTLALYPDVSILDWKINEDTYWTYGNRERRDRYENDVNRFRRLLIERATKEVNYKFFNVLTKGKTDKRTLFEQITDNADKYVMLSKDMAFLYVPGSGVTIGISLEQVDYEGGDRKKFLGAIYGNPHNKVIKEKDVVSDEMRKLVQGDRYVIPYLASLSQENKF